MPRSKQVVPNGFQGGRVVLQRAVALGTGAVADQNAIIGLIPKGSKIVGVRTAQQADITGTSLTLDIFLRTSAGAAGSSILASTISLDVADAAAGKAGQDGTLSTTVANLEAAEDLMLEAVFDATAVTAGPGDVLISVELAPAVAL